MAARKIASARGRRYREPAGDGSSGGAANGARDVGAPSAEAPSKPVSATSSRSAGAGGANPAGVPPSSHPPAAGGTSSSQPRLQATPVLRPTWRPTRISESSSCSWNQPRVPMVQPKCACASGRTLPRWTPQLQSRGTSGRRCKPSGRDGARGGGSGEGARQRAAVAPLERGVLRAYEA